MRASAQGVPALAPLGAPVFREVVSDDGAPVLEVAARTAGSVNPLSASHPAPGSGAMYLQPLVVQGSTVRMRGRFSLDPGLGLAGLAATRRDGTWVLAGLVPGAAGIDVALSRSNGSWSGEPKRGSFVVPAGGWFWLEAEVVDAGTSRAWRVFAWNDGEPRPEVAVAEASEGLDGGSALAEAGVWASGSGLRRFGELVVEVGAQPSAAAGAAAASPPSVRVTPSGAVELEVARTGETVRIEPDAFDRFATRGERATASAAFGGGRAMGTCDGFKFRYSGQASSYPGSQAFLRLSPIDNDCDGLFDEDPSGGGDQDGDGRTDEDGPESKLDWLSNDSRFGVWGTGPVDASLGYVILYFPFRVYCVFAYASQGNWLLGTVRVLPTGGGTALRGHGLATVAYDLSFLASTPLSVTILESGAPLADGALFTRPVVLTALTEGGSGAATVTATVDGQPFALGTSYAVEGTHTITVAASDQGGQQATATRQLGIDLSAPVFSDITPPDGALTAAAGVALAGRVSADTAQVTVGGTPASLGAVQGSTRPFTSQTVPLVEGVTTVALRAVDGVGLVTELDWHVERDGTAPLVTISSPSSGTIVGAASTPVTGTASDLHLSGVSVNGIAATLTGGTWSATVPLLPGSNQITASASDQVGNTSSATVTVIRDNTSPQITIYESGTPVSGPLSLGRPAVFTAQVTDDTTVQVSASVDGVTYALGTPYSAEGSHQLTVSATDEGGNTAAETAAFSIDLTAPVIEVQSPVAGSVVAAEAVTVSGRVSADTVSVQVGGQSAALEVPAGEWRSFSAGGVALPSEGTNLVAVQAADGVGNTAAIEHPLVRDTAGPQLTVTSPEEGLITRFEAQVAAGQASDPHLQGVTLGGQPLALGADGSFTTTVTLAEGPTSLAFVATDTLGHATTVTRHVTLDTIPPAITVRADGQPLAEGLLVNHAIAPVIEFQDATAVQPTILLNGVPFVSGTAVANEGLFLLSIQAVDAAGNQSSLDRHFRIDTSKPMLSGIQPADGTVTNQAGQTLTGQCDDAVTVTVNGAPAQVVSGSFTFAGLMLAEGENTLALTATDAAGNSQTASHRLVLDTQPPVLTLSEPAEGATIRPSTVHVVGTATDPHLEAVAVNGVPAALSGGAFQADVPLPNEGSSAIQVVARDRAGNQATVVRTVERDATPPDLVVNTPGPGSVLASSTVQVSGTATDPHLLGVTVNQTPVQLAGNAFSTDLSLPEGPHTIVVEATDTLGLSSRVERSIRVDLTAPTVRIDEPAAGAFLTSTTVPVRGQAQDAEGIARVTVNGREATVQGTGAFELADLALPEGESTVTCRAFDTAGNSGVVSRTVTVDVQPPAVTSIVPSDGATGVPTSVLPRITFSEPIAPASLAGQITLTAGGVPIQVQVALDAAATAATVTPVGGLQSGVEHHLTVQTGITDRAGRALAAAAQAHFTTTDVTPPPAPQVDPLPSPACVTAAQVSGHAEPGARIEVTGAVQPAQTTAGADGAFAVSVTPTVPAGAVSLTVTAVDAAGNRSAAVPLLFDLDCQPPQVVDATWTRPADPGQTVITVRLSEPPAPATLVAGSTVQVAGSSGALVFASALAGNVLELTLAQRPADSELPVTLDLTQQVTDLAGNALATPFRRLFTDGQSLTLVAGEVFDDATSLPLAGVRVTLVEDGGPVADPQPYVYTDGRGRFQLPVAGSPVTVRAERDGFAPGWRRVVPQPGFSTLVFDLRLTPLGEVHHLSGSAELSTPGFTLTVPAAAVPSGGLDLKLTPLSEQGLPNLLPPGWSVDRAVCVDVSVSLTPPAALTLTGSLAPDGVLATFDAVTQAWTAVAMSAVLDVTTSGVWAVVVPDPPPGGPGQAAAGFPLPAATQADPGELTGQLALDPPTILPTQIATGSLDVTPTYPFASGLAVEASLDEALTLVDGRTLVQPPAATDLVVYRHDASYRAVFRLGASDEARRLSLSQGVKEVRVRALPAGARTENLVGPAGGTLATPQGVGLVVPAGALSGMTSVDLADRPADLLPIPLPAGLASERVVSLELGAALLVPAELSFPLGPEPDVQHLVLVPLAIEDVTVWRLVGVAIHEGDRLVCAPSAAPDLPAPWVTSGGLFVLVRPAADAWGLVSGVVLDVSGSPASPVRVDASPGGLVQLSQPTGAYATAAPAGAVALAATHLVTRNTGSAATTLTAGGHLASQNIQLAVVPPVVVATSPAHGAQRVSMTSPVTVDFSEPLDPASVGTDSVAVFTFLGTGEGVPHAGSLALSSDGTRISWSPGQPYPSAALVKVFLSPTLRDRQGNLLAGTRELHFSVERVLLPGDVNPERILLFAPGHDPAEPDTAVVEGGELSVPGGVALWVENLDRLIETVTVTASQTGAFTIHLAMWDPAVHRGVQVGDTLLLHLVDAASGADLGVVPLRPWLLADGNSALVDPEGGTFTSAQGVKVEIPAGALPAGGTVGVVTRDPASVQLPAEAAAFLGARAAVDLSLSSSAMAGLHLTIPGQAPTNPSTALLVATMVSIGGKQVPMVVSTATWDPATQRYATGPPPSGWSPAGGVQVLAGESLDAPGARTQSFEGCDRLDAIVAAGTLAVLEPAAAIAMVMGPLAGGPLLGSSGFCYDSALFAGGRIFACDAFLIPVPRTGPFTLKGVDPDTGFVQWERGFAAPTGGWVELPPEEIPGVSMGRLLVEGGMPFDLYAFHAGEGEEPLATGIVATRSEDRTLVTITAGAVKAGRRVRLIDLLAGQVGQGTTGSGGALVVGVKASVGAPLLLAIEGTLASPEDPLVLDLSRRVGAPQTPAHVSVRIEGGGHLPGLEVDADGRRLEIAPSDYWEAGASYTLVLEKQLFVQQGSGQDEVSVELPFRVAAVGEGNPIFGGTVADSELAGDVLLLAARDSGLRAFDVSDPASPVQRGSFQAVGGVAAVAADGFGLVGVLTGNTGTDDALRLLSLDDLMTAQGEVSQLASILLSAADGDAAGFLEAETIANDVAFRLADLPKAGISVVRDEGVWTELHIPASLLSARHPVLLRDQVTGRVLWRQTVPDPVPAEGIVLTPGALNMPVAEGRTLVLRSHLETVWYAFTQSGVARVFRTVRAAGGGVDLEEPPGSYVPNSAVGQWLRGKGSGVTCRMPGAEDLVFYGRLALAPWRGFRPVLLAATPYDGLLSYTPNAGAVSVMPNGVVCMRTDASARLADVAAARWQWPDGSESTIVAAVGHRRLEILELDPTTGLPVRLTGMTTDWDPFRVAIALDPRGQLILVRDNAGNLAVYAFRARPTAANPLPPVHLYTIEVPGSSGPLTVNPELGLAYLGSTPVQYRAPEVKAVTDQDGDGRLEQVTYLQPLGAPAPPVTAGNPRPPYLAWLVAQVAGIPDGTDTLDVTVAGLGPGGGELPNRPAPYLPSKVTVRLRRGQGLPSGAHLPLDDASRHTFISDRPILLVADERARTGYWDRLSADDRAKLTDTAHGPALCRNCSRDLDGDGTQDLPWGIPGLHSGPSGEGEPDTGKPIEIAAAARVQLALDVPTSQWLSRLAQQGITPTSEVQSVAWAPSPAVGARPGISTPAPGVPEVDLPTRALRLGRADLSLAAPGMDIGVGRTYTSGGIVWGDFGWGWQLAGADRLRPNPDGTVDLVAAGGERYVFSSGGPGILPGQQGKVLTAWGIPAELAGKKGGGFILKLGDGSYEEFDAWGQLERVRDRYRTAETAGSEIAYRWGANGLLVSIEQRNGTGSHETKPRRFTFERDAMGLVTTIKDSTEREMSFTYDQYGRMTLAQHQEVEIDAQGGKGTPKESLTLVVVPGFTPLDVAAALDRGGRLELVKDTAGRSILDPTWDAGSHELTKACRGEVCHTLSKPAEPTPARGPRSNPPGPGQTTRTAVIADAQGRQVQVSWDELGRATTTIVDPGGSASATLQTTYGAGNDPLPATETLLSGAAVTYTWGTSQPGGARRTAWNLQQATQAADTLGTATASTPVSLGTSYAYLAGTSLPTATTFPGGRTWLTPRDGRGAPTATVDPEGRTTTEVRDVMGRLISSTEPGGHVTTTEFDDAFTGVGEPSKVTPPARDVVDGASTERHTELRYDQRGNLKAVISPAPGPDDQRPVRHRRTNALGWVLEEWTDASPEASSGAFGIDRVSYVYDADGRLLSEQHGGSDKVLTVTHDTTEAGLPLRRAETGGGTRTTVYVYPSGASDGRVRQVLRSETNRGLSFDYDARGRLTSRSVGGHTTTFTYGRSDDLPSSVTDPDGRLTTLGYDPFGRRNITTDALGRRTELDLDAGGRVRQQKLVVAGHTAFQRDQAFNQADQLTATTDWRSVLPAEPATGESLVTSITYDQRGLPQSVTDPLGRVSTFAYDGTGAESTRTLPDGTSIETRYWPSGDVGTVTERPAVPGQGPASYTDRSEYDLTGRLARSIAPDGQVTTFSYDALGRLQSRLDPDGRLHTWDTTPVGMQIVESLAGKTVTTRTLDEDGLLTSLAEQGGATFTATYDSAGRLQQRTLPGGVSHTLHWTNAGILSAVDLPGATVSHQLDAAGRRIGTTVAGGAMPPEWVTSQALAYDPLDQIVSASDDRGVAIARHTSSLGEVLDETLTVDGQSWTTTAAYDKAGNLTSLTYPDGTALSALPDPLDRIDTLSVGGTQLWKGQYNGLRVGGETKGALVLQRAHTARGLPENIRATAGGGAQPSQRFALEREYDPVGRFVGQVVATTSRRIDSLVHDAAARLTGFRSEATLPIPSLPDLGWNALPAKPAKERSARQTSPGDDLLSTLDMRLGKLRGESFTPDPTSHRVLLGAGLGFSYDPFGNRATAEQGTGSTTTYLHDWDNRLLAVGLEGVPTPHTRFRYDPLGRRVAETVSGLTTVRLHWGERVLEEDVLALDGTVRPRKRLYWGNRIDELAAYDWDGDLDGTLETRLYPLQDDQGTVHAVADGDGVIAESYLVRQDGTVQIYGSDRTPPRLVLGRVRPLVAGQPQTLQLVFSEDVQATGTTAVALSGPGGTPHPLTLAPAAGRVWTATLAPTLLPGDAFTLTVSGVEDLAGNQILPQSLPFVAPEPAAGLVLPGTAEADLLAVLDGPTGLALVLGTPVDPGAIPAGLVSVKRAGLAVAGSVSVHTGGAQPLEGAVLMWTPTDPQAYQPGACEVTIAAGLVDLAGHPIHGPPDAIAYDHSGQGDVVWARPEDAPILSASQVGNDRFLHGRPLVATLGLYDHRARFYDPTTQTFLEPDPLGPVDSPNLYQAFGLDPQNNTDPLGLSSVCDWYKVNGGTPPPECPALRGAGPTATPPPVVFPTGASATVEQIRSQSSPRFGPSSGAELRPIVGDNPVSGLFWHVTDSFFGGALSNEYANWQPLNDPQTAANVKHFREKYGLAYKGINLLSSITGAKKLEIAVDALDLGLDIADRNFKGGAHSEMKTPVGDDLDSHHMPAKSVSPIDPEMGPAIQMEKADHKLTSSWGTSPASLEYRENIKTLLAEGKWREAMAVEIRDVRRVAGTKYNKAVRQMLDYARSLGLLKKK